MESNENFEAGHEPDLVSFHLRILSMYAQSLVSRTLRTVNRSIENFRIAELFDLINEKIAEHPPLRFLVFASPLCCALPATLFIIFGVVSAIVGFAGFLVIEGTLLALGGLCMFLCILSLILILSAFSMIFGVFYMLALKLGYVLNGLEENSNEVRRSLPPATSDRNRSSSFESIRIKEILRIQFFRIIDILFYFSDFLYLFWKIIFSFFYLFLKQLERLNII